MLLFGWLLYRVRFAGNPALYLGGVLLCALAMFAVGYVIASLAPSARAAP